MIARCSVLSPSSNAACSEYSRIRLRVLLNSNVKEIHSDSVDIIVGDKLGKLKNDAVIVSAGGILPSAFLRTIGINVETKWGTE